MAHPAPADTSPEGLVFAKWYEGTMQENDRRFRQRFDMRVQVKIRNLDSPDLTEQQVESSNIPLGVSTSRQTCRSTSAPESRCSSPCRWKLREKTPGFGAARDASCACSRAVRRKRKPATESRFTITKCSIKPGRPSQIPDPDVSRSRNSEVPEMHRRCTRSDAIRGGQETDAQASPDR